MSKDLAAFRAEHGPADHAAQMRRALNELGGTWEPEADFIRRCSMSPAQFAKVRDQFPGFMVQVTGRHPKRVWAGTEKFAATLRATLKGPQ